MNIKILIPTLDDGHKKVTVYDVDGKTIEKVYNYGKGWGYLFLSEYDSLEHYCRRMTSVGGKLIYSSSLQSDCTNDGRAIEYELMKQGI